MNFQFLGFLLGPARTGFHSLAVRQRPEEQVAAEPASCQLMSLQSLLFCSSTCSNYANSTKANLLPEPGECNGGVSHKVRRFWHSLPTAPAHSFASSVQRRRTREGRQNNVDTQYNRRDGECSKYVEHMCIRYLMKRQELVKRGG